MKTLVVVPTYNESGCISALLDELAAIELDLGVLVVDDNSPDGTAAVVQAWSESGDLPIRVMSRPVKEGLGAAYRAAFAQVLSSEYDVVVQMDADGSHPVQALPRMLQTVVDGADLVIGSRYAPGGGYTPEWPRRRRLLSRAGNRYARVILGVPIRDLTGGFKMWRTSILRNSAVRDSSARGYAFQVETTYAAILAGARVTEVPIVFAQRAAGTSKMSVAVVFEALLGLPRLRRRLRAAFVRHPMSAVSRDQAPISHSTELTTA